MLLDKMDSLADLPAYHDTKRWDALKAILKPVPETLVAGAVLALRKAKQLQGQHNPYHPLFSFLIAVLYAASYMASELCCC